MVENYYLALLAGIIAAVGWGLSGFFDAKASRGVNPIVASLMVNAIVAIGYAIVYLIFLYDTFVIDTAGIWFAIASGSIITVGALAYFKGLSIGPVALVSPMSSAYPILTALIALFAFGGSMTGVQIMAIFLIVFGVIIVTELLGTIRKRSVMQTGPLLGLVAALCWGTGYALAAQSIARLGWEQGTFVEFMAMLAAFIVCVPFLSREALSKSALMQGMRNTYIWTAGLIALVAATCFNLGLSYDASSGAIVATMSSFYPILTVLLALRHFDEHVQPKQLIGVGLSILGIIVLTIG